jgi:hypothetical protein
MWRTVEQNGEHGYESTQLCPPDFWQRYQKIYEGEKAGSLTNVTRKKGYLTAENWNYIQLISTSTITLY